jgi:hypothetical protein
MKCYARARVNTMRAARVPEQEGKVETRLSLGPRQIEGGETPICPGYMPAYVDIERQMLACADTWV